VAGHNQSGHVPRGLRGQSVAGKPASVRHFQVNTIDERVAHIVALAVKGSTDPAIRQHALTAVRQRCGDGWCTPEGDGDAEIRAVFAYLKQHYRYVHDPSGRDWFQHPVRTLELGGGDCDDAASLVAAMMASIGYQTKLRVIRTHNAPTWNHIYTLVGLPANKPSRWIPIDLTVDKPVGWEAPMRVIAQIRDFPVPAAS